MSVDVLTVSSKGQIVLPAPIRKMLSISSGDKLAAYASNDAVLLKPIKLPSESDFATWLDEAQAWAAEAGFAEEDVNDIIKATRAKKRR